MMNGHSEDIYLTVQKIIDRKLKVTAMESVTGGMIASLFTDREGVSAVFRGSFVTYSNEAKIAAGVDPVIIERYGVYSEECAVAMALAAQKAFEADIAIGVTGVLANIDPENSQGTPGTVFFAIATGDKVHPGKITDIPVTNRHDSKLYVCSEIFGRLNDLL